MPSVHVSTVYFQLCHVVLNGEKWHTEGANNHSVTAESSENAVINSVILHSHDIAEHVEGFDE